MMLLLILILIVNPGNSDADSDSGCASFVLIFGSHAHTVAGEYMNLTREPWLNDAKLLRTYAWRFHELKHICLHRFSLQDSCLSICSSHDAHRIYCFL